MPRSGRRGVRSRPRKNAGLPESGAAPSLPSSEDYARKAKLAKALVTPLLVVPLPRRPLFPGYMTSAYLENQPGLARSLKASGAEFVAAFMLKDNSGYRGCILRPGIEGKELLERLHPVGTLAAVSKLEEGEPTGRVFLHGHRRVRMAPGAASIVRYDPVTVLVQPLDDNVDELEHLFEGPGAPVADFARGALSLIEPYMEVLRLMEALSGHHAMDPNGQVGWYIEQWGGNLRFLSNFGPAVLPVLDKALHQQALEELDPFKRLEITNSMVKRELEMDSKMDVRLDLKEEEFSEEEKELLAQLRGPGLTSLEKESFRMNTGELLMAPSVQMRVRLQAFRGQMPPDKFKGGGMKQLKTTRVGEHMMGY